MDEISRAATNCSRRQSHETSIDLLGDSEQMAAVRELIDRVAETDVTVLIRGESGTGKELVARALHAGSPRHDGPFIKVNCAALPADLLESEMFGFERGAFTGALQAKPGKFEFANHGTIFLDEIAEMSTSLQAKLLHVLQDGEFSRLGSHGDLRVDVRIVAATNRALEQAVSEGLFREDLFFRLNVVCVSMPPLRDRRQEIPQLLDYFLKKYSRHYNRPGTEISAETLELFMQHDWPGNVRELENVIQRIVILGSESPGWNPLMARRPDPPPVVEPVERRRHDRRRTPRVAALPPPPPPPVAPLPPPIAVVTSIPDVARAVESAKVGEHPSLKAIGRTAARAAEREMILRMLHRTRWNRKEAAEILGISYKALLYKIKENRLDEPMSDSDH